MTDVKSQIINYEEIYFGSRQFIFLSERSGLPIDQVNFVIAQLTAVLLAWIFRVLLHPTKVSTSTRHKAAFTAGLSLAYFCFGKQVLFALGMLVVCYTLLTVLPPTTFHRVTMVASLVFLSALHLQRQFMQDGLFVLDITGALMIMVQRATALAYNLHDGLTKSTDELTQVQKQTAVRKKPTILEYFSYMMSFQSILAGPFIFFVDYKEFIEGTHYLKYIPKATARPVEPVNNNIDSPLPEKNMKITPENEPNPTKIALTKVLWGIIISSTLVTLVPKYSVFHLTEPWFLSMSFLYKMSYIVLVTSLSRALYYTGWLLADGVCNMSGLGYSGATSQGKHSWDKVSNVDIYNVEFGESLKTILDSWNIRTMQWLRLCVYERVAYNATLATFAVSCIWHGFYPGYYLAFASAAFFTTSARRLRRCLRARILEMDMPIVKSLYDFAGWFCSHLVLGYVSFSFVMLKMGPALIVYRSLWFYLHILGVVVPLVISYHFPPVPSSKAGSASTTTGDTSAGLKKRL